VHKGPLNLEVELQSILPFFHGHAEPFGKVSEKPLETLFLRLRPAECSL
jgi:hypothetical protein